MADEAARRSEWTYGSHLKCERTAVRRSLHRMVRPLRDGCVFAGMVISVLDTECTQILP